MAGGKRGVGLPCLCAENITRDRRGSWVPQVAQTKLKLKCLSSTWFWVGKKLRGLREGHLLSEQPMARVEAGCAGPGGLCAVVLGGRVAALGLGCGSGALSGAEEGDLLADVGVLAVLQSPAGSSGAQGRCGWQDPAGGQRPERERHQCLSGCVGELGPWGGGFAPRVGAGSRLWRRSSSG